MSVHVRVVGAPAAASAGGRGSVRNSTIVLATSDRKRVLLLRGRDGTFAPPGGKIDPGEAPFGAMRREFGEEVGQPLPFIPGLRNFTYGRTGHTKVYYGTLPRGVKVVFRTNDEKVAMEFWTIAAVLNAPPFLFSEGAQGSLRIAVDRILTDS